MDGEPLSESVKDIVSEMRKLVKNKKAIREQKGEMVWQYGGQDFLNEIVRLKAEMVNMGKKVVECNAFHFGRGANIKNPTKRLILIPINGTSTLRPGGPLLPETSLYIEDERSLLGGEGGVDVIFVALAEEGKE